MNSMSLKAPLPVDVRLMNASALVLAVIAALMTLGALLWWAARHPAFAISRIVVQGDTQHHNAITLQANVAGKLKGNFFTLDMASVRQSFEAVPWVRRAVVRREFPDGLRVVLEEHQAQAFWSLSSESRMVNSYGELFEANAGEAETDELPRLVGADSQSKQILETYRSLAALFKPYDAQLDVLELSGRGNWRAELDSGGVLELGRGSPQEVLQRTQRFLQSHERVMAAYQRSGLDKVESVDLRHRDAYAIRMRGVTTVSSVQESAGAAKR